jgi:thiol-disulfide isomerase/thioredoxin
MLIPAFLAAIALADVLVPGGSAPAFTPDSFVKGEAFKSLEPGKVHVVEFWATWCPPCVASIPHLTELQKGNPDVRVIGVAGCERGADAGANESNVRRFIQAKGDSAGYTIVFDGDGTMFRDWMQAARRNTIPTAFIVGKDGKVAWIGSPFEGLDEAVGKAKAAPEVKRTVDVKEEPTDEKGSSSSTGSSTESHAKTANGVKTTETVVTETKVEVKDGKRTTTVTRTVTRTTEPAAPAAQDGAFSQGHGSLVGSSGSSGSSGNP